MVNVRSVTLGFAAGTIPGIAALSLGVAFTGLTAGKIDHHSFIIEVVGPSLVFAAIGGTLGALTSTSLLGHSPAQGARRRETTTSGKRYRVAAGLVAGMVPGLSGLIYTIDLFLGCYRGFGTRLIHQARMSGPSARMSGPSEFVSSCIYSCNRDRGTLRVVGRRIPCCQSRPTCLTSIWLVDGPTFERPRANP